VRAVNADLHAHSKVVHPFVDANGWELQGDDVTFFLNTTGGYQLLQMAGYLHTGNPD
jgi:predicted peroxiredoxin